MVLVRPNDATPSRMIQHVDSAVSSCKGLFQMESRKKNFTQYNRQSKGCWT